MSKTEHSVMHVLNIQTYIHRQHAKTKGQWYCSSTLPGHILESESVFIVCSHSTEVLFMGY